MVSRQGLQLRCSGWRYAAALLLCALLQPFAAGAAERCDAADARGIQRCSAGLADLQIAQMQRTQLGANWCWAASIAMVFAHHGYAVSQQQVVQRQFGALQDLAISGPEISAHLNREWRDQSGRGFQASAKGGDVAGPLNRQAPAALIAQLAQEQPLVLGADGHAVVLVEVQYERFTLQDAVRITGGKVIDPAPGRGVRALSASELRPSYVVAVGVAETTRVAMAVPPLRN